MVTPRWHGVACAARAHAHAHITSSTNLTLFGRTLHVTSCALLDSLHTHTPTHNFAIFACMQPHGLHILLPHHTAAPAAPGSLLLLLHPACPLHISRAPTSVCAPSPFFVYLCRTAACKPAFFPCPAFDVQFHHASIGGRFVCQNLLGVFGSVSVNGKIFIGSRSCGARPYCPNLHAARSCMHEQQARPLFGPLGL